MVLSHGDKAAYSFFIVAIMNRHSCHGVNITDLLPYCSGGQKSNSGLTGLKSRCRKGCAPLLRVQWGAHFSCLFQFLEAACVTWLLDPSSFFKVSNVTSLPPSFHNQVALSYLPTCKDPWEDLGPPTQSRIISLV